MKSNLSPLGIQPTDLADPRKLVRKILEIARKRFRVERAALYLYNPNLGDLVFVLALGVGAAIAGGGTAGIIQMGTTWVRGMSSVTTGGFGNFIIATGEWLGAFTTATLTVLFPIAVTILVILLIIVGSRRLLRPRTPLTSG